MVCVTSRIFVKPYVPSTILGIDDSTTHTIEITYVKQEIAAPKDFPNFVDIDIIKNVEEIPSGVKLPNMENKRVTFYLQMLKNIQSALQLQHWIRCTDKQIGMKQWRLGSRIVIIRINCTNFNHVSQELGEASGQP